MTISKRFNAFIHEWMIRYVRNTYRRRIRARERQFPGIFKNVREETRREHSRLWGKFGYGVCDSWLRQFYGLTGIEDPRFCPNDLFYTVVERRMNHCDSAGSGVENKVDVSFYIPEELQPETVLRYVRGVFFDREMRPITARQADGLLVSCRDDVIGKPALYSSGGKGVELFRSDGQGRKRSSSGKLLTASWIEENEMAYVVQERVRQEPSSAAFNPSSLNTCRMMTFRRPWSGKVSVAGAMFRIGGGASCVDNLSSGGVSIGIGHDGRLAPFATDYAFRKYRTHPVSGLQLGGMEMPFYDEMAEAVCKCAARIPGFNILGFDVAVRPGGVPCIIEINATSQAVLEVQMTGPLFGEETERVIDWCAEHRRFDQFNHFRTFY